MRRTDYVRKCIVYKVPSEEKKQSIETLKVRKTTLEYLRQNGFKTVEDIIDKQLEIPSKYSIEETFMRILCLELRTKICLVTKQI